MLCKESIYSWMKWQAQDLRLLAHIAVKEVFSLINCVKLKLSSKQVIEIMYPREACMA